MTYNTTFTSFLKKIFFISLFIVNSLSKENILSKTKKALQSEHLCNTKALSTFLPDIKYDSDLKPFKGSSDVREICPNLDDSCCRSHQLNNLSDQLKRSFGFLSYRSEIIVKMFKRVKGIDPKIFDSFIDELSHEDIKCYNGIQDEVLDKKKQMYSKYPAKQRMIEKTRKKLIFKEKKIKRVFVLLQDMIKPYLTKMENTNLRREKFYSGTVCSMCSPNFSKQMTLSDNQPMLFVNKFMCNQVIREKIDFAESLNIFPHLQKIINIVYCSRKNSKSSQNYIDIAWNDLNLIPFDPDVLSDYKKKRQDCLQDEYSYFSGIEMSKECVNYCQNGFKFFKTSMVSMDNFLRIENEFFNMFGNHHKSNKVSAERLNRKIEHYHSKRKEMIQEEQITFDEEKNIENLYFIKNVPNSTITFENSKIDLTKVNGMHVANTPMNEVYYKRGMINKFIFGGLLLLLVF
jgi:hypothetical protein